MKFLNFFLFFLVIHGWIHAQDIVKSDETSDVAAIVKDQRFRFVARSVDPARGRTIYLSGTYTLTVLPDSIICDLPFYGRAYQATMNPSDAGFKFTSTDFSYTVKERKRGGQDITIKTKDVSNAPQILIFMGNQGNSSVRITSIDRESISYSGYIKKPDQN